VDDKIFKNLTTFPSIALLVGALTCMIGFVAFAKSNPTQEGWTPKKIDPINRESSAGIKLSIGSIVQLANGVRLESDLVGMRYIGQLPTHSKAPYLIFSASGCDACDMNIAIYILSPTAGSFNRAAKGKRYDYPGRLFTFGINKKLIRESRLFIGECLPGRGPIAVWFIKSRSAAGIWEDSVYIAEGKDDRLSTGFLKPPLPKLNEMLSLVQSGKCREVEGQDLTEEP
jgi:hypothetical protein